MQDSIELNGRHYRKPSRPTVVVCIDGCDPEYLRRGRCDQILPTIDACAREGYFGAASAVVPTFTNPNNVSIVTGAPPAVHGISGNYCLDRDSGREIMMTDPSLLRSDTILALMAQGGVKTAAITAKDKLRRLLGHRLRGICLSSEQADRCTIEEHGIASVERLVGRLRPDMYSADLSLFVLDAGKKLLEGGDAELLYLSLSDYVQHKCAPGEAEADDFHRAVDDRLRQLLELGAVIGVTADHGMNDKALPNGAPNVVFLEDELNRGFGAGVVRVICPITDPFVRHHGALGSFVRVYRRDGPSVERLIDATVSLPGIARVLDAAAAAAEYDLPLDREGDFVAIGARNTVVGSSRAAHDLSYLAGHRLRSHGGLAEQTVPFILSRPLTPEYAHIAASRQLRNFDIFDFVLNGTE